MDFEKYMLPCLNKKLFGIECMGCGAQRAFLYLFQGEFSLAFKLFPAVYTTLLFFLVVALHFIDKSRNYFKIIIGLAITNACIMIISYIYKLINSYN